MKLSAARATVKEKLIQAFIDNLNEERSVRFIAHLVSIWGPDQCKPTSKKKNKIKKILNKSIDLVEKTLQKSKKFLSFKKASESINEIKLKWQTN